MYSTNNNDGLAKIINAVLKSLSNKKPEPSTSKLPKISIPSFLKGKPVDPIDAALSNIIDIIYELAYNKPPSSFSFKNNMLSVFNRGSQNRVANSSNTSFYHNFLSSPSTSSSSQTQTTNLLSYTPSYKKTEPLNGPCTVNVDKDSNSQFPVAYEDGEQGEAGCKLDKVPTKKTEQI